MIAMMFPAKLSTEGLLGDVFVSSGRLYGLSRMEIKLLNAFGIYLYFGLSLSVGLLLPIINPLQLSLDKSAWETMSDHRYIRAGSPNRFAGRRSGAPSPSPSRSPAPASIFGDQTPRYPPTPARMLPRDSIAARSPFVYEEDGEGALATPQTGRSLRSNLPTMDVDILEIDMIPEEYEQRQRDRQASFVQTVTDQSAGPIRFGPRLSDRFIVPSWGRTWQSRIKPGLWTAATNGAAGVVLVQQRIRLGSRIRGWFFRAWRHILFEIFLVALVLGCCSLGFYAYLNLALFVQKEPELWREVQAVIKGHAIKAVYLMDRVWTSAYVWLLKVLGLEADEHV